MHRVRDPRPRIFAYKALQNTEALHMFLLLCAFVQSAHIVDPARPPRIFIRFVPSTGTMLGSILYKMMDLNANVLIY